MATCGRCGTQFPTCYMDMVSSCPKCGTTFYNDSPGMLSNVASEAPADWKPADTENKPPQEKGLESKPKEVKKKKLFSFWKKS